MSTLTDFLLARIAEDEAVATAHRDDDDAWGNPYSSGASLAFERRFAPERIAVECEAKRKIVAEHAAIEVYRGQPLVCTTCVKVDEGGSYITTGAEDVFPCNTLRSLASVYADHPDYLNEWANTCVLPPGVGA